MTRVVQCVVLKKEAEGLDKPPHPGSLGTRIYENVSKEGWQQWLERLTTIINENGLNTKATTARPRPASRPAAAKNNYRVEDLNLTQRRGDAKNAKES